VGGGAEGGSTMAKYSYRGGISFNILWHSRCTTVFNTLLSIV
jgi:hypothetical protein